MSKFISLLMLWIATGAAIPSLPAQTAGNQTAWNLVFEDDFTGSSVNTTNWEIYVSPGLNGNGIRSASAITVTNGMLVITAQMVDGVLVSGGMALAHNYLYGKYEFRVRTDPDPSKTMSGVVLTWPKSGIWPAEGENDMYETGNTDPNRTSFYSAIHYGTGPNETNDNAYIFRDYTSATNWHVIDMEWTPTALRMYRDGAMTSTLFDTNAIQHPAHHLCIQLDSFKSSMTGVVAMDVSYVKVFQATFQTNEVTPLMQYEFEDSGTTTTDSVSGVALNLVNGSGVATDLHGTNGSGVAGIGQALDLRRGTYTAGPLAFTTNNSSIAFGTISSFTATLWLNPLNNEFAPTWDRYFILGVDGVTDARAPNSIALENNGNTDYQSSSLDAVQGWINGWVSPTTNTATQTPIHISMPTNQWTFVAVTYDGTNYTAYRGTESNAVKQVGTAAFSNAVVNFGAYMPAFSLFLGNNNARAATFLGQMDDVRFYSGAAGSNCLEDVRWAALAPQGLRAMPGTNQINLSWFALSAAANYTVLRAETSGGPYATIANGVVGTNYTDSTMGLGTNYYAVSAVDAEGDGCMSHSSAQIAVAAYPNTNVLAIGFSPTNQNVILNYPGIAGYAYRVQASTNLALPMWTDIGTNTAGTDGLWRFDDTNAAVYPQRFYRTVYP